MTKKYDQALDQRLIVWLLSGIPVRDKRGRWLPPIYPKTGFEELEARRALARELRTSRPLDLGMRMLLADAFDPDRDEVEREVQFKYRRKGKRRANAMAENEIAEFIWARVQAGDKLESVVSTALKHFGYGEKSRSHVINIWSRWQPILKRRCRLKPLSPQDWGDKERRRLSLARRR